MRPRRAPKPATLPAAWEGYHLPLSADGSTHAGALGSCPACAAWLRAHPEAPVPAGTVWR